MSTHHLDHLFNPGSVAVIGASEQEGSIGSVLMQNMIQAGFQGRIHPVNPKYGSIHGFTARASILDLEEAPDLAVIAIPIQTVPDIIEDCVQAGTKGAVIISAGGREAGPEGVKLEERIKARADQTGLRIIGPNCLGIIAPGNKLNASFAAHMPDKGRLAFISQSGAICTSMLDLSLKENMGFRYFISIGSMLDVDFGDLIDYVGSDSGVESILLYIESLTQVRKFMSAARGISRLKPIVIIKSGKSAAGARAASSHTGALAGEDSVYDVAFRRTGAVRVRTIGDFFRCAELLAKGPRARGPRLTVLTNSGGPGVMAVDAINEYGLETAELSRETLDNLNRVLPEHWSRANPVDILGDASAERYVQAVNTLENTETDGLLVILNPQAMTDPGQVARDLSPVLSGKPFPVLTSWMGGRYVEKGIEIFNQAGISTFDTPEQAVRSFKYLHDYTRNLKKLTEIPPRVPERLHFDRDAAQSMLQTGLSRKDGLLTEIEAKDVIRAYGIPVNRTESAASEDEAVRLARDMGYPLAMKLLAQTITHKTDAGGVRLNLGSEEQIRSAYAAIMKAARDYDPEADVQGVSLQEMIPNPQLELLLGLKRDDNFGPVLVFGMGGVFTEILADRNMALPPMNRLLAQRLMQGTKVYRLLSGYRKRPGADLLAFEEVIIRLSHLAIDFPEIAELDLNPVIVHEGKPLALDARAVIRSSEQASPRHLVISPYPSHYEFPGVHVGGLSFCIRPIQPEDAGLLQELFETLSRTSVYYRFFSPLRTLSQEMLARFTQIDYDREMALVALASENGRDRLLGVARIIRQIEGSDGEFAIVVGDPWQGRGIGEELLKRCLDIARDMGMGRVWGLALPQNAGMIRLGDKLGMTRHWDREQEAYALQIDLN